jgi:hypothetical protein
MNLKSIVQGFGAAILVLILRVWPHLSSYHPAIYHTFLPMRSVIWGILIDLGIFTLLAALLFHYLEKSETGRRTAVWAFVAAGLVSPLVSALTALRRAPIPYLNSNVISVVVLLVALLLRWLRPLDYRRSVHGFGILLVLAGCSMLWMVPELLYQGLFAQGTDAAVPVNHPVLVSGGKRSPEQGGRIVWLLFDELSYDQTFEHRFPGLAMPAFDQFKSQSVVFTNLKPAGYYTERAIPAFFLGKTVDNIRSKLNGEPLIKLNGSDRWQAFDAQKTLFADAQRLGWTTGVAGWYNPYCRILAGTLDYCYWRMGDGQSDGALPDHSAWQNAAAPLMEIAREIKHEPGLAEKKHAEDQLAIMPQAEFIHLPVPHPPSIYNRAHRKATGSYIDSLALADQSLAALMTTLRGTASVATTTVIVCSDHSWRVPMWRSTYWTKEDEAASQGRFDPRPVLMIHFPGQQTEREVTAPFEQIRIHEIIQHLLRGQEPGFDKALLAAKP